MGAFNLHVVNLILILLYQIVCLNHTLTFIIDHIQLNVCCDFDDHSEVHFHEISPLHVSFYIRIVLPISLTPRLRQSIHPIRLSVYFGTKSLPKINYFHLHLIFNNFMTRITVIAVVEIEYLDFLGVSIEICQAIEEDSMEIRLTHWAETYHVRVRDRSKKC